MYECYMWSMPHVIYARHNEHDFLALRVQDNGLNIVKDGLDLLRKFSCSLGRSQRHCVRAEP